ncbi:MAG TPA: hypothetical protein VNT75_30845 [Symbiobacteriaceae bacterium]|nr:hypothetical protein [Symbiobacteriaceae bacterium]
MNGNNVDKLRLADRTEAILRSDRSALKKTARRQQHEPAILLTLVPDVGPVIDLMDAYVSDIAEMANLQYVRLIGQEHRELPEHLLDRTFLALADLTGRDESVVTLVYQALSRGRRVLLATQDGMEIPEELGYLPKVTYSLGEGMFDQLLRAVRQASCSTMEDYIAL